MISRIGEFGLAATLLVGVGALAGALAGMRPGTERWARLARIGLGLGAALSTALIAWLGWALVTSDMTVAYVADHTERSLPAGYRLAALWAGQEGSLLLWAWMASLVAAGAALQRQIRRLRGEGARLATLAAVNTFFAALLLLAANPFAKTAGEPPLHGQGLNPLLQHWAMVMHPPLLFAGYAFSLAPFAAMVGGLVAGGRGGWSLGVRRWALASWIFLSAGISLGAWWAYVELGWGGYWAWDPVENASLLPWLTGTALLHTLAIDRQRGQLREWTASLCAATFLLCLVATYITRGGVIESVHAFGRSSVGNFFLAAIVAGAACSAGLIAGRWRVLRSGPEIESLVSREGIFVIGNVLLVAMAGVVLLGTLSPVLSGLFAPDQMAVGASFYNRVVAPLGLALAALMALGPVLVCGRGAGEGFARDLAGPVTVTLAAVCTAAATGVRSVAALACVAIAAMTVTLIARALWRATAAAARAQGVSPLRAAARVIDNDHRRYGGQLAHLGLVLVILGVAGSSLYSQRASVTLSRGESVRVGGYDVRLGPLAEVRGPNFSAVEASLIATDARGRSVELRPQRRFYSMSVDSYAEVAIRSRLREDLYVALLGWEAGGDRAAVLVLVNPLAAWIWVGAAAMACGGAFALTPRLAPAGRRWLAGGTNESIAHTPTHTPRRGRGLAGGVGATAR